MLLVLLKKQFASIVVFLNRVIISFSVQKDPCGSVR